MSRGGEILVLLVGEDVGGDEMDLGVTVLSGLGGRHVDDLARSVLDHDETVLTQSRALHRVGGRGTGIGRVEGHLMLHESKKQQLAKFLIRAEHDGNVAVHYFLVTDEAQIKDKIKGQHCIVGHKSQCGVKISRRKWAQRQISWA